MFANAIFHFAIHIVILKARENHEYIAKAQIDSSLGQHCIMR